MRKYFCALLVLYLSLLTGAEMAWAELKPGQGVIDAMGIVTALGRISPRGDWSMPSDAQARIWLDELKEL